MADDRMYAQKTNARQSPGEQSSNVLFQRAGGARPGSRRASRGRRPSSRSPSASSSGVEQRGCTSCAGRRGSTTSARWRCPESILLKPGPLDEREWEFVRRHTIVGQRILEAAPSLGGAGAVVRSTHERWDGTGYPDGSPARTSRSARGSSPSATRSTRWSRTGRTARRWRSARRCRSSPAAAGTQFDPAVVTAFLDALAERPPSRARGVPEPAVDHALRAKLRVVEAEDDPPELAAAGSR